ncbi:hypothetical protein PV04_04507 [Phialophora macrospora]|uniref:Uncharacterized protein n=1 Tax=Phialophora macrospora TaxID=1851006 RepID=A0A0D2G9I5_9EURO|nr:hypothetical protein PV04_04507 [Phialophora macrospora]
MAGFSTPQLARSPSSQQAKQMSSRLLNMKFMQRAAAASPTTSTAASSTVHTPATEPSAKRRRVESNTSSPVTSVPGTPMNEIPNGLATPIMVRGGVSTFRHEQAETEWVLDVKVRLPQQKRSGYASKGNGNGSADPNGFSALVDRDEEGGDNSSEEDIWTTTQPSGRQTFGSFRKGKSRNTTQADQSREDDEDLSSASDADEHFDSDEDSRSESSSNSCTARHRKTPTSHGKSRVNPTKDLNSDDEMRQVRQAIEQKHRNMRGTAGDHPKAKHGNKRGGREQGSYKTRKKARKTI